MTETLREKIGFWRDLLMLSGVISGFATLFMGVIFAGVMSIWGPQLKTNAQDWLGISTLTDNIASLNGNTRITRMPVGMSYVREPVYLGEDIDLVIYIGRTERGVNCELERIIPLFTDDNGVVFAGVPRTPAQQLATTEIVRRELTLPQPEDLRAGRVSLQLQLHYHCDEGRVLENTLAVSYYALEGNRP